MIWLVCTCESMHITSLFPVPNYLNLSNFEYNLLDFLHFVFGLSRQ